MDWLAAGLPSEGREAAPDASPKLGTLVKAGGATCTLSQSVQAALGRLQDTGDPVCAVVDGSAMFLGMLTRHAAESGHGTAAEAMQVDAKTFRPSAKPSDAAKYMQEHDLAAVPVTTGDGVFVGVVPRAAAEDAARRS